MDLVWFGPKKPVVAAFEIDDQKSDGSARCSHKEGCDDASKDDVSSRSAQLSNSELVESQAHRIVNNNDHSAINRDQVKIVQTPQTFLSSILVTAFNRSYQDSFTDEATVVEASGESVHLIEGEYSNLKVTRPTDLLLARAILDERKK